MTIQIIPTKDGAIRPAYPQTVTLDGVPFTLFFQFNLRQSCWYVSVATVDGQDVWNGLKMVCNWDLLLGCQDTRRPAGRLLVITNSADDSTPGLSDLGPGARCSLAYIPAADVVSVLRGTFVAG